MRISSTRFRIARLAGAAVLLAALSACSRTTLPEVATAPPPPPVTAAPMPAGGRPGMAIPARLADGSYATPNHALSPAAAIWHLRTALNVAALACRDAEEAQTAAAYNALLAAQKPQLARAERSLSDEYRAAGGDWRDAYDDSMTRLYNYWAQDFARAAFCARARALLAMAPGVPADGFGAFAQASLAELDRPFTDFFRAYDAWRAQEPTPLVVAPVASVPVGAPAIVPVVHPVAVPAAPRPAPAPMPAPAAPPFLTVDVAALG